MANPPNPKNTSTESDGSALQSAPSIPEQCFLIDQAKDILDALKSKNQIGSGDMVRQIGEESLQGYTTNLKYINDITLAQNSKNFFEITPAQKAQLAHYAVIYVVKKGATANSSTKKNIFQDSALADFSTGDAFLTSGRRTGAGIKSIKITHEGIDSATKNVALVNAQFVFQDIREMLIDPYVELFKIGTKEEINGKTIYRTIEFELGWKTHDKLATKLGLGGKQNQMKLKLKTNLVKYTFDLNQNGSITVNAQYRGHIMDVFN